MHSHPTLSPNAQNSPCQIPHSMHYGDDSTPFSCKDHHLISTPPPNTSSWTTNDRQPASFAIAQKPGATRSMVNALFNKRPHPHPGSPLCVHHGGSLRIVRSWAEHHGETAIILIVKAADVAWQADGWVGVWCATNTTSYRFFWAFKCKQMYWL